MAVVAVRLSMRAYAAHRKAAGLKGGSLSAVQKAVKSGRIRLDRDGLIDPSEADPSWTRRTDPTQGVELERGRRAPGKAAPVHVPRIEDDQPLDLLQERARLTKAQADKHELDNAERAGLLINRDLAMHVFSMQISAAKNRLVGMGSKMAVELCGLLGAPTGRAVEVEEVIDCEVREILEELSTDAAESDLR